MEKKNNAMTSSNKQKNIVRKSNINDDENQMIFMILIFSIIFKKSIEDNKMWEEFSESIKTESHFFPRGELLKKIEKITTYATCTLEKGTILYRAREYGQEDFSKNEEITNLSSMMEERYPNLSSMSQGELANVMHELIIFFRDGKLSEIQRKIEEKKKAKEPFWGFDKRGSDAPPSEKALEGRANARGISYLYTAMDRKTAIQEMKPQIGRMYSVGKIILREDVKIFNFAYTKTELEAEEYLSSLELFNISQHFSKPNLGDNQEYLPTQYICEFIRKVGFEGIKFKSSVSNDGYNVLLFDTRLNYKKYDIVESRVYSVKNIDIEAEEILPMNLQKIVDKLWRKKCDI